MFNDGLTPQDEAFFRANNDEQVRKTIARLRSELAAAEAQAAALRAALERLGSSEAMIGPLAIDRGPTGAELQARIQYARDKLTALALSPVGPAHD